MTDTPFFDRQLGVDGNPTFVVSHDVPEIYADGIAGASHSPSTIKINLFSDRFNPQQEKTERVIVARLVIPLGSLHQFRAAFDGLTNIVATSSAKSGTIK